ncbi:MAG: preprotein translocase subunit SecE [Flexilinea sp.]|jgi:preprotein translocase subunit SecE
MAEINNQKNVKAEKKLQPKKANKLTKWWNETIGELRKVVWPTREDAWRMTKIVLVVVFGMAAFLGLVDFAFSKLIGVLLG